MMGLQVRSFILELCMLSNNSNPDVQYMYLLLNISIKEEKLFSPMGIPVSMVTHPALLSSNGIYSLPKGTVHFLTWRIILFWIEKRLCNADVIFCL
jgi:hypothetical protein